MWLHKQPAKPRKMQEIILEEPVSVAYRRQMLGMPGLLQIRGTGSAYDHSSQRQLPVEERDSPQGLFSRSLDRIRRRVVRIMMHRMRIRPGRLCDFGSQLATI